MRQSDEPTDRERCEMEIIKSLMRSYFDIARKNFQVSLVAKILQLQSASAVYFFRDWSTFWCMCCRFRQRL